MVWKPDSWGNTSKVKIRGNSVWGKLCGYLPGASPQQASGRGWGGQAAAPPPGGTGTFREGKELSCFGENQNTICKTVLGKKRKTWREEPSQRPETAREPCPDSGRAGCFLLPRRRWLLRHCLRHASGPVPSAQHAVSAQPPYTLPANPPPLPKPVRVDASVLGRGLCVQHLIPVVRAF